jgi:hypothetical protein
MLKSGISWRSDGVRPMRRWQISAEVILAVALIGLTPIWLAAAPVPQEQGVGLGPGCAPDRPAITHHAGGVKVDAPRATDAPIPCVTMTGLRVGEESIVVTNLGTVLLRPIRDVEAPAAPKLGFVRSVDQGAHWEAPNAPSNDTNMWVDRRTGRVFWTSRNRTDISDDDGKTWFSGGRTLNFDHIQVFGGPPTESLKRRMQGYPNVVYVCVGHMPLKCQKSLDGGLTWGPELDIPYPPELAAIQGAAHDCSAFGEQGVVDKDGTVYVPYNPCNRPYVAISHDEGENWQLVAMADTGELSGGNLPLGMDEQGNLYAAWTGASDRLLYMAISRDHGMHWGTPMMIGAPGVNEAAIPELVAGARGLVAVAYYGSKNAPHPFPAPCFPVPAGARPTGGFGAPATGPTPSCPGYENETWDTYVTESWNTLDAQPLFWSATLNAPAQPTWYGCTPSYVGVQRWDEYFLAGPGFFRGCYPRLVMDYFGVTMAPDGTVWVGFAQECPFGQPAPGNNPNCPSMSDPGGLWGLVGRLVPQGEHAGVTQKITENSGASRP